MESDQHRNFIWHVEPELTKPSNGYTSSNFDHNRVLNDHIGVRSDMGLRWRWCKALERRGYGGPCPYYGGFYGGFSNGKVIEVEGCP
ncbi:hypothetical protein COLO4_06657 [Corchorus olitorius]|uniref:Uncharacterized protein n=1 Tax=Corchorus olitorius TaxID=93759 RepID=A0A1R3KMK9_9ROSI|nr:hypothetical protein COLO4_06657 [Corchorus olitorius]